MSVGMITDGWVCVSAGMLTDGWICLEIAPAPIEIDGLTASIFIQTELEALPFVALTVYADPIVGAYSVASGLFESPTVAATGLQVAGTLTAAITAALTMAVPEEETAQSADVSADDLAAVASPAGSLTANETIGTSTISVVSIAASTISVVTILETTEGVIIS